MIPSENSPAPSHSGKQCWVGAVAIVIFQEGEGGGLKLMMNSSSIIIIPSFPRER